MATHILMDTLIPTNISLVAADADITKVMASIAASVITSLKVDIKMGTAAAVLATIRMDTTTVKAKAVATINSSNCHIGLPATVYSE